MNAPLGNIRAIAKRELAGYFSSPVAYVFIVIFLLLIGFFTFTLGHFFERGQANLDSFFMWHPWLYLFLVPCVGMRLWAEERRVGTIELLLTKPVTLREAIIGKFLASWIFLGLALALTFPVIITVNYLGMPDNGVIIAAYLGSWLMAGAYLAISSMTSAMTRNQVISFILSVVICLFLVLCGYPPVTGLLMRLDKPWLVDLVSSLSVMTHFKPFSTGLINTQDTIFFLLLIGFALFANGVIILNHQASSDRLLKRKAFERIVYSTGGLAAMFVVMISAYILAGAFNVRFDITSDKEHTLSAGTIRILDSLDSRVTVRFYCTQSGNDMPPQLKAYGQQVSEMLQEYESDAHGHILVEKLDPQPDSAAENSAQTDGVEGRPTGAFGSDKVYMGIAVSLLDRKFVLPWLSPDRARLLEYDLSRAIDRVISHSRPMIGVMTALPVWGGAQDPLMRPGQNGAEQWAFITELKKDFDVQQVSLAATNIGSSINILLVADPVGISGQTQYAIDQFVLRGGKLLAFLDPHAYFDQTHSQSDKFSVEGDNAAKSSLPILLKAWGLDMDVNTVVADTTFGGRNMQTGDSMPTLLLVTQSGIDQTDVVTCQMDNLAIPFAGAFVGKPAEGLKETVLVKSSPNSKLVDTLIATSASREILRDFKPSNVEYPLVVRLTQTFKTAFPDGRPGEDGVGVPAPGQLKQSARPGEVVLVSDSDMLNDKVSVTEQEVMGQRLVYPINGNLNFVQSLVEEMSGDDNLITARSRANMDHPFTRVKEMEAKAGKQWEEKAQALETQQRDMDQKIKELQARGGNNQGVILTADQDQELAAYKQSLARLTDELKHVRESLRKDTQALEFRTKVINIGAMPALVALSGLCLAIIRSHRRMPRKTSPPIPNLTRQIQQESIGASPGKRRVQMDRKQFSLALVALAVIGIAGLILVHRNRDTWLLREAKTGAKVFPNLHINDIASIHVEGNGSTFSVIHTNDLWCVRERDGYAANLPMIRDFLLKIRDLKVVQSDLIGPSQLPRLNLAPPGTGTNCGTLVEFRDKHGNLLASLLAGKLHPRPQDDSEPVGLHGLFDGRYISLPGDYGHALLVSDDLITITSDPGAWLSPDFFKAEHIKFISLVSPNGANSWEISRANDSSPWSLDNASPGETLNIKAADDVGEILAFPSFNDVAPKTTSLTAGQGLDRPIIVTVLTDHFMYTLNVGRQQADGNYPMTVAVKADISTNDVDAPELQDKLARERALTPWIYEAGPWIERVTRPRSELLEENTDASGQTAQ